MTHYTAPTILFVYPRDTTSLIVHIILFLGGGGRNSIHAFKAWRAVKTVPGARRPQNAHPNPPLTWNSLWQDVDVRAGGIIPIEFFPRLRRTQMSNIQDHHRKVLETLNDSRQPVTACQHILVHSLQVSPHLAAPFFQHQQQQSESSRSSNY